MLGGQGVGQNLYVGDLAGSGNRAVYSTAAGELTNTSSDERLKTNISTFDMGLSETISLNPVYYNWINYEKLGSQREVGFLAGQIKDVLPEAVQTNSDGSLSLDYVRLIPMLVNSIKELKTKVDDLTTRVQSLES